MISLHLRFQFAAAAVLVLFLSVTAIALDRVFEQSATAAMRERLFARIYYLLAEAEVDRAGHLSVPERLAETGLDVPGSGLYAWVRAGDEVWVSPSAPAREAARVPDGLPPGETRFGRWPDNAGAYFQAALGVAWESGGNLFPLTVAIVEDAQSFETAMKRYRRHLWGWLGAMSVLLMAALAGVIRLGLSPLRGLSRDLASIESGTQTSLQGRYPKELRQLTGSLNGLLAHETARRTRVRNAMSDLAHSLKTPLAILDDLGERGRFGGTDRDTLQEQVGRLSEIVHYQLQRATLEGHRPLEPSRPLGPVAERIRASLEKVYRDKAPAIGIAVDDSVRYRAAEEDLMEVFGNLMDNACKWCERRIQVTGACREGVLEIAVDDDGPGIAAERAGELLDRGVRLDEATPGHGIGLGMVRDIASSYGGRLAIERSNLGGLRAVVTLPAC